MALLDAYATATEYDVRNEKTDTSADIRILEMLTSVSRVVEQRCRVAPGGWNSATGTRVFDGNGVRKLFLRDERGDMNFLQLIAADGLKIDFDQDGVFEVTWDLADAWVHGSPANAAAFSEPFTALEIYPLGVAPLSIFPPFKGCVQITGTWGWAAVPGGFKERVISITRELIEVHRAGPTLSVSEVDASIQLNPGARSLMAMIEKEYSQYVPGHRAV